jgi:hypothetical protein
VPAAMQSTPGTDVSAFANAMDTPEGGTRNTRSGCTPGRVLSSLWQYPRRHRGGVSRSSCSRGDAPLAGRDAGPHVRAAARHPAAGGVGSLRAVLRSSQPRLSATRPVGPVAPRAS